MNVEWSSGLRSRAEVHAALAEPARLAIVERLLLGDAAPGELGTALGLPSNLLAHHVNWLAKAGLLSRSKSEGDHRRSYLRLNAAALDAVRPSARRRAPRVLFVCTRNSARSQLARALWQRASRVPAASAGTRPAEKIHAQAVVVARRHGLWLKDAGPAHVDDVRRPGDLVVAVCDNAHEELGGDPARRLHWSVPDPALSGEAAAFERAFRDLSDRVERLAPAVQPDEES